MSISTLLNNSSAKWQRALPASADALNQLLTQAGVELPGDYIEFLLHSNGGEGDLGVQPGWFRIWPAENVIEQNRDYEVSENAPGFFGFGSSGGGEMLAFDMRGSKPWPVVMLPYIGMEPEMALPVANDFAQFVQQLGRENDDA